jgi:predicted small metal-binding protein
MEAPMTDEILTVRCACGWETSGPEAEIVPATVEHGRRLHNMDATREQVLAMASITPADREAVDAVDAVERTGA